MNIEIIKKPATFRLHGFSGVAADQNWGKTGFQLMDKMWAVVREKKLKHKGINHWVYESENRMFVGVELEDEGGSDTGLEMEIFTLPQYAYYKHIGPYQLLKEAYAAVRAEIKALGFQSGSPGLEIYGHWNADETKLETEILMTIL